MKIIEICSFEVEWPREVKPDDLARVDSFRAQKRSPGASVAEFMISEANGFREPLLDKARRLQSRGVWNELNEDRLDDVLNSILAYKQVAYAFLYGEETIRNGKPPISIGDLEREQVAIRLEYDQRVTRGRDNPIRTITKIVTHSAQYYFRLCCLGVDLTKKTPVEAVDSWVDFAISFYEKSGLGKEFVQPQIFGLKKGRDRFNLLLQKIQEPL